MARETVAINLTENHITLLHAPSADGGTTSSQFPKSLSAAAHLSLICLELRTAEESQTANFDFCQRRCRALSLFLRALSELGVSSRLTHDVAAEASPVTTKMSEERDAKRRRTESSPVTPVEVINLDSDDDDDVVAIASDATSDDDDIMVVPIQAAPVVAPVVPSAPAGDDDDEIQAVGEVQPSALYPHARADCRVHNFVKELTDAAHDANQSTCEKCYCYVCDDEAAKCGVWEKHCMASDKKTVWRNLRTRKRAKPNAPIVVPVLALPPRLRGAVSAPDPQDALLGGRRRNGNVANAFVTAHRANGLSAARSRAVLMAQQQSHQPQLWAQVQAQVQAQQMASGYGASSGYGGGASGYGGGAAVKSQPNTADAHRIARQKRYDEEVAKRKELAEKRKEMLDKQRDLVIPKQGKTYSFKVMPSTTASPVPTYLKETNRKMSLVGVIDFYRPYCSHLSTKLPSNMTHSGTMVGHHTVKELATTSSPMLKKKAARILAVEAGIAPGGKHLHETIYAPSHLLAGLPQVFGKHVESSFSADKHGLSDYVYQSLEEGIKVGLIHVRWELEHYEGSTGSNVDGALGCLHECLDTDFMQEKFSEHLKSTLDWRKKCDERVDGVDKFSLSNCCRLRAWVSLMPSAFTSNMVRVAADLVPKNSIPESYQIPIDGVGYGVGTAPSDAWGYSAPRPAETSILGRILTCVQFANFQNCPMSLSPSSFLPKDHENVGLLKPAFRGSKYLDGKVVEEHEKLYKSKGAMLPDPEGGGTGNQQKLFSIEGILSSPLFTVSEGYVGGSAAQPTGMNVTLRPYQLETLKWMQDQEARPSISDPFWVKLTSAPLYGSAPAAGAATKWEPFWYCPLNGAVSRSRPPKVVGGILADSMGLGKVRSISKQRSISKHSSQYRCNVTTQHPNLILLSLLFYNRRYLRSPW